MEEHNLTIHPLNNSDYTYLPNAPKDMLLQNKIVLYYNGAIWKVVPLEYFLSFPIIYDKYIINEDDTRYKKNEVDFDITIVVCPFTLASCVFEGKLTPSKYVLNSSLLLQDNKNNLLCIETGKYISGVTSIKRFETEIKIFKNSLNDNPDCSYMHLNATLPKSLLNPDYYESNKLLFKIKKNSLDIHPKELVYVIQYRSSKSNSDEKYTILVGKQIDKQKLNYDIQKSGISEYIESLENKLQEKSGFVIPIYWFACKAFFPDAKIIHL